jgi:prepilin-type N-terminal cleavage/methylation domain-containing protein
MKKGFTLVEILITVGIIGVLATLVMVALNSGGAKGRDAKRKSDVSQIGRFFALSCYQPNSGDGTYDLSLIIDELKIKYPQFASSVPKNLYDPSAGTETETFYIYIIESGNCVLYANLENEDEKITLENLTAPTPGRGAGVLQASALGANGTNIYFQVSN